MSTLSILGGEPIRAPRKPWPSWPPVTESAVDQVSEVVRSGVWAYDGPKEWEFAHIFEEFSGIKHCLPVANGTVAIQMALEALGIGAYDEVIVPGLTWQATAAACLDVNAVPVLVDVDPNTFCLDLKKAEEAISEKTRAIVVVHLYGSMTDMDALLQLAARYKLPVVEDCAHQHGSRWNGVHVGGLGRVGTFSLQLSKVLTSGEGGICLTDDWELFQKLYSLRNCGRPLRTDSPTLQSGNYRMTELQAALLVAQMEIFSAAVARRDENAVYLNKTLADIPGIIPLHRNPKVTRQSYYCYAFRYDAAAWDGLPVEIFRNALSKELELSVESTYAPLNDSPLYKPHSKKRHKLSEEYWQAINPRRFELPVCRRLYSEQAVTVRQPFLLSAPSDVQEFQQGVEKLYENRDQLIAYWKRTIAHEESPIEPYAK